MAPARFRTNPHPLKKRMAAREKRMHRLEGSGVVSLWKAGLDSCQKEIVIGLSPASSEWALWQYRDTLKSGYPTS